VVIWFAFFLTACDATPARKWVDEVSVYFEKGVIEQGPGDRHDGRRSEGGVMLTKYVGGQNDAFSAMEEMRTELPLQIIRSQETATEAASEESSEVADLLREVVKGNEKTAALLTKIHEEQLREPASVTAAQAQAAGWKPSVPEKNDLLTMLLVLGAGGGGAIGIRRMRGNGTAPPTVKMDPS